mmetsp:Transcript_23921/g.70453  ORF Transcript_23921/g.70453 Transcript_23921/m.70453 type:complete len:439 (-) Transcript_23921:439-1755(-)
MYTARLPAAGRALSRSAHSSSKALASIEGENIFAQCTQLAVKAGAVNLGQGFPSWPTPSFVSEVAREKIADGFNQYSRPGGHPNFVSAVAEVYSPRFAQKLDGMTNVCATAGATGALFTIFSSLADAGDEVVCIDPAYDAYKKMAKILRVNMTGVPLEFPAGGPPTSAQQLQLDMSKLDAALSDRTRMLILNTPHNPTGKVFSRAEYEAIAEVVRKYPQLIVVSDDVYEASVASGLEHVRFATLPGMWERTISVYSAGKTFSCTGWRVGYMVAPSDITAHLLKAQSITAHSNAAPLEQAVAESLRAAETNGYYQELPALLEGKRNIIASALARAGLRPMVSGGGYFLMCDTSHLPVDAPASGPNTPLAERRDFLACKYLTEEVGVTGIPTAGFYSPENRALADNTLRFAYCKADEDLSDAANRLSKFTFGDAEEAALG